MGGEQAGGIEDIELDLVLDAEAPRLAMNVAGLVAGGADVVDGAGQGR
ncbi:hypothetical protein OIE71_25605 [Streptomyces sp. NBC_01725]|nr:hypothetical protein [Streptomyces sp. NBC_01725]